MNTQANPLQVLTVVLALAGATACTTPSVRPVDVPRGLSELPLLLPGRPGSFVEVKRERRAGIETEGMNLMQEADIKDEPEDLERESVPALGSIGGLQVFEFYDIESGRSFAYAVDRDELAAASRKVAEYPNEHGRQEKPPARRDVEQEDVQTKSWSNATDNRIRRAIADGFSDTHSIYQSLADYGGCSATVLSANSRRMVAITAAHCVFTAGNNFSNSKLRPRRNGTTSPTWGAWSAYAFGYYPQYLDNDCEDDWDGGDCIKHDIALVIASPDSGASAPRGMGWGYRPKSFLNNHSKYRRGYPGCNNGHSPASCTTNNLYGDGALSVGNFSQKDSDGWNRRIKFSSDVNPGDSGSGLYYYRNGNPYVFAVTSAEPSSCKTTCSSSRPNSARRITPQFFDFINSVIF